MAYIYLFLSLFLFGLISLLLYQRILDIKPKQILPFLTIPVFFSCILLLLTQYFHLPTRELFSIPLLALSLWIWGRKINWAGLIFAFSLCYAVWFFSIIIAAFFGQLLGVLGNDSDFILAFFIESLFYFVLYRHFRLKHGNTFIESREGKGIVFTSAGIMIAAFAGLHVLAEHVNFALFLTAWVILAIVIFVLSILIIRFARRYMEKLEQQKQILVEQKRTLEREQHNYQQVVPAVRWTNAYVLENIKSITETGDVSKLKEMEHYLNLVGEVNMELIVYLANKIRAELA